MNIIFSSRNPRKLEEVQAIFAGTDIVVLGLDDVGIEGEAEENGRTLKENALKKASFAQERCLQNYLAVADDTGIEIDELDGNPGVDTAMWPYLRPTTQDVLKALEGLKNRSATFRTVVAVVTPDGQHWFYEGKVRGTLLKSARGPLHPRMPYGPIFLPDGQEKTFAEMSIDEENAISHRGQAFMQAKEFLAKQ